MNETKNDNIVFSIAELKIFTKIYASNWHHVPKQFKEQNYQGLGIDDKIHQFVRDIRQLQIKRETLCDLLLQFYHQGDADDTEHFINTICELFDFPDL